MRQFYRWLAVLNTQRLKALTLSSCGLFVALAAFWGLRLVSLKMDLKRVQKDTTRHELELSETRRVLAQAKGSGPYGARTRSSRMARIQQTIESNCRSAGCSVQDFQVSPDRAPYISPYTKQGTKAGWQQVEARVVASGPLTGLVSAFRGLPSAGCTVEVVSVDIGPDPSAAPGEDRVMASLLIRLLIPDSGGNT